MKETFFALLLGGLAATIMFTTMDEPVVGDECAARYGDGWRQVDTLQAGADTIPVCQKLTTETVGDKIKLPTDEDIDAVVRAMIGEARSQSDEEIRALTHVVINRAQSGKYPSTLKEVAFQAAQFHGLTSNLPTAKYARTVDVQSLDYRRVLSLVNQVVRDRTRGVTPVGCLGRALNFDHLHGRREPSWMRRASCRVTVGDATIVSLN